MNLRTLALRLIAASAVPGLFACQRTEVARIEISRRSFELYGGAPFVLPVRVIDHEGRIRPVRELEMRVVEGGVVRVLRGSGAVVCKRAGAAHVELRAGALRESVAVRCRPIASFRGAQSLQLTVGDAPRPVVVQAIFATGEEAIMPPISLTSRNEDIARLQGDSIVAVAPGRTTVDAQLGGLNLPIGVFVSAVIASDTLTLRAGQFRNWVLDAGHYTMTVSSVPPQHERRWLDLIADGTRCARSLRVENTVTCVVYDRGAVVVRNTLTDAEAPARRAFVRIVRTP